MIHLLDTEVDWMLQSVAEKRSANSASLYHEHEVFAEEITLRSNKC